MAARRLIRRVYFHAPLVDRDRRRLLHLRAGERGRKPRRGVFQPGDVPEPVVRRGRRHAAGPQYDHAHGRRRPQPGRHAALLGQRLSLHCHQPECRRRVGEAVGALLPSRRCGRRAGHAHRAVHVQPDHVHVPASWAPSRRAPTSLLPSSSIWAGIAFDNNGGATGATAAQLDSLAQGIFSPAEARHQRRPVLRHDGRRFVRLGQPGRHDHQFRRDTASGFRLGDPDRAGRRPVDHQV